MENKYGFIYMTTNNVNGKRYIGQKKIDNKYKWKSYLGSGIHLKNAIDKYGKENFTREILEYADNINELNELEKKYIEEFNAVNSDEFYNAVEGGDVVDKFSNINSTPVINIETGYVFKSIKHASEWIGYSEIFIKKSLDYRHCHKNKTNELIFKKLSTVKNGCKLCSCCASNIDFYKKDKFCEDCLGKDGFNVEDFNIMVMANHLELYTLESKWVKEYINKNTTEVCKYYPLRKEFDRNNKRKKWVRIDNKTYCM